MAQDPLNPLQKNGQMTAAESLDDLPQHNRSEDRLEDWPEDRSETKPEHWIETVARISGLPHPAWAAHLLWDRGLRSAEALEGFLQVANYTPASPFEFGEEMDWAIARLIAARDRAEKIAIWGDFDADGVTSTAVLWDGLREFFPKADQLTYFIPNRLKASHGLSLTGVEQLAAEGVNLIVTCDTGSTNPREIERANALGMAVIVTDHHTLPVQRPPVVAIVNPRSLPPAHPMAHLSGVAVAYKLIEALYERLPDVPTRPLSELVDLVAIGLIADLVELKGDCRYLAQIGITQLQKHLQTPQPIRPGVARLLQLCQRAGDRPTDISFGIGPRINAVSRIYGDASFCVELLTSRDPERCRELAEKAELANARRKALQNDVLQQVNHQLETQDLSTMGVIVLCDRQWPVGVLGLVAGQVAQQYGKPTLLLTLDSPAAEGSDAEGKTLARGSARSVNQIDLYDLVNSQAHLLTSFGGHPFAAGLSLPVENLPLFTAAINQQYRQKMGTQGTQPPVADLTVTVADLGRALFQELKLLEPCGMGNPVPKLLIKNCWFENVWHQKLKDRAGAKIDYIKASFNLCDDSLHGDPSLRFPGLWWGHYKEDLPPGRWDAIAELDYNSHPKSRRYEIRLIEIQPSAVTEQATGVTGAARAMAGAMTVEGSSVRASIRASISTLPTNWLRDRRLAPNSTDISEPSSLIKTGMSETGLFETGLSETGLSETGLSETDLSETDLSETDLPETDLILSECPTQWQEFSLWRHQSNQTRQHLALAYAPPAAVDPLHKWKTLLGLAKYLSREQMAVTPERLCAALEVCDRTLSIGLSALAKAGFTIQQSAIDIRMRYQAEALAQEDAAGAEALSRFLAAVQEEHFRRQYFYQTPVSTLEAAIETET